MGQTNILSSLILSKPKTIVRERQWNHGSREVQVASSSWSRPLSIAAGGDVNKSPERIRGKPVKPVMVAGNDYGN